MQKVIKYVIFQTKWGYFGLAGTKFGLLRTHLPGPNREKIKSLILKNLLATNQNTSIEQRESCNENRVSSIEKRVSSIEHRVSRIEFDKSFFKILQEQITAYFDGTCINFNPAIPVVLIGLTQFYCQVLTACREVKFGQTTTYAALANKIGRPASSRAVGNALAKNPLPLIIPCHRVIRSPRHRVICSPRRFAWQSEIEGGKLNPAQANIGGFSAPGGISLKKKMLELERQALRA